MPCETLNDVTISQTVCKATRVEVFENFWLCSLSLVKTIQFKLQSRFEMCIFLRHSIGYKGVIYYNFKSRKSIVSRHIVFYETVFPYTKYYCQDQTQKDDIGVSSARTMVIPVPIPVRSLVKDTTRHQSHYVNIVFSFLWSNDRVINSSTSSKVQEQTSIVSGTSSRI